MAKKVEPEKQLINRLIKYSKGHVRDNSFFMGGDGKSKPLHNWSLDPNQLREETRLKISHLMNDENLENSHLYKGDNEEIRNLCKTIKEKISSLPLDTLYFKQLANISDFISKLSRTIFDYERDYAKATSEVTKSTITNNTKQALEGYIQALEKANEYYRSLAVEETFSTQKYSEVIHNAKLDATYEEDLALVRAFDFIGITIEREGNEWVYKEDKTNKNDNGYKYKNEYGIEVPYKLDSDSVRAFVSGYLNNPERNGKVITPSGLFRFYVESMTSSTKGLTALEKSQLENIRKNAETQFTANSDTWKSFLLSDKQLIRRDATRLAIADLFKFQYPILEGEFYSDETQEIFKNNDRIYTKPLDRMEDILLKEYKALQERLSSKNGFANENYKAIYDKYTDNNSIATFAGIRYFQQQFFSKLFTSNDNPSVESDTANLRKLEDVLEKVNDFEFLSVNVQDGKYELIIDQDKVPSEYSEIINSALQEANKEINNIILTEINGHTKNAQSTQSQGSATSIQSEQSSILNASQNMTEDILKFTAGEIYDMVFEAGLGEDAEISQMLEDEAIYSRTSFVNSAGSNIFTQAIENFVNNNGGKDSPDFKFDGKALSKHLASQGIDLDNFLFTEESLTRILNSDYNNEIARKNAKAFLVLSAMEKEINSNAELNKRLREAKNQEEQDEILKNVYNKIASSINLDEITAEQLSEINKYRTINKKKSYDRIENFVEKEGQPAVNLIDERIQDPQLKNLLKGQSSKAKADYKQIVPNENSQQQGQNGQDGQPKSEKPEKPYSYNDKFGKNDGSATLKKLKPYCKKSSTKILDDIIKEIDKTMIYPQKKQDIITSSGSKDRGDELSDDGDSYDSADTDTREDVEDSEDEANSTSVQAYGQTSQGLEQNGQAEEGKYNLDNIKYVYSIAGHILKEQLKGKRIANAQFGQKFKDLISLLDYIGSPEGNNAEKDLKYEVLMAINSLLSIQNEQTEAKVAEVVAKLQSLPNNQMITSIINVLTDKEQRHLLLGALLLTSTIGSDFKLDVGSKLPPELIEQLKACKTNEDIYRIINAGSLKGIEREALVLLADCVNLEEIVGSNNALQSDSAVSDARLDDFNDFLQKAYDMVMNNSTQYTELKNGTIITKTENGITVQQNGETKFISSEEIIRMYNEKFSSMSGSINDDDIIEGIFDEMSR